MADTAISALTAAAAAAAANEIVINEAGTSKKLTLAQLLTYIAANIPTIATDALWDAAGDVVVGTGANTAARLAVSTTAGQALVADPDATGKLSFNNPLGVEAANQGVSGSLAATMKRLDIVSAACAIATTGKLLLHAIYLPKGFTVSTITWYAGTTAANTPLNQWAALFDSSRVLRAISADATSGAWAGNAAKAFAMTTPYVTTYAGLWYIGLMVKATTQPSMCGATTSVTAAGTPRVLAPIPVGSASDTGLTDPASCPSTAGALTAAAVCLYAEVS